jgi:MFS transporter, MHS family, proline/betaine transporter
VAERGVPLSRALAGALLGLVVMGAAAPALGRLSDHVGRRPLLAAATIGLLVLTLPVHLLVRRGGPVGVLLGYLMLGAVLGCFVLPSILSELFPTRVRSTGLALTYGLGSAMFGARHRSWTSSWWRAPATRWFPRTMPAPWPSWQPSASR